MVVQRDKNFRKVYDLTISYVKNDLLEKTEFSEEERQIYRLKLKLQAFPVISVGKVTRTKQDKLKTSKKLGFSIEKLKDFEDQKDRRTPILVKLEDRTGYIVPSNWKELSQIPIDDEIRGIGPLDPFIWDRNLVKHLFGFNYVWEVYKKPKDRIWGYYVYPLLYKGDFIGRFEAKLNKKLKKLDFFNFKEVKGFKLDNDVENAFGNLLYRWKHMLEADIVSYDSSFPEKIMIA